MEIEQQLTPFERFVQFVDADFGGRAIEADRLAKEMVKFDGMPSEFVELRRQLVAYRKALRTGSGWPKRSCRGGGIQPQIENSLDVQAVAKRVGRAARTIRRWVASKSLYAVWDGKSWRIPDFQFTQNGSEMITGISEVNQMLTGELDPTAVCNWFHEPNPEIRIDGEIVSPVEWLLAGRPPTVLARHVIALHIGAN